MDIEEAKRKLQAVLTAARLRREGIEQSEALATVIVEQHAQPASQAQPAPQTAAQDVHTEALPVPELEPTPGTHPELFIEVRTPELIRLGRDAGNDEGREVLSGRMLITYRRRLPTDADQPFILVPPTSRRKPNEETAEWDRFGDHPGAVDPRVLKRFANDRTSPSTWIERNSRFALDRGNRFVIGHEND
jgi:hypothetical protein